MTKLLERTISTTLPASQVQVNQSTRSFALRTKRNVDLTGSAASCSSAVDLNELVTNDVTPAALPGKETLGITASFASAIAKLVCDTVATFILVIALGLGVLATLPLVVGLRSVVVTSGSMSPAINTADVVVTSKGSNPDIAIGTVVDFETPEGSLIHRVVALTDTGYRTKGDANPTPDSTEMTSEDILGVGVYVIPLVGMPNIWLAERAWWKLILAATVFAVCTVVVRQEWANPERGEAMSCSTSFRSSERGYLS